MTGPHVEVRDKGLKIVGWKNKTGISYQIKKSYKNKEGQYVDSNSFFVDELERVKQLIEQVVDASKAEEVEDDEWGE